MQPSSLEIDPFLQARDAKRQELEACQKEQNPSAEIPSCFLCTKLVGCPLRLAYVKTVYESMSKGESGGFEF